MSTYVTKRAKELGLKKVDASAPLKLEVRPQDIAAAERKNSKDCAFARACKRTQKADAASPHPRLLSVTAAARELSISRRTIYSLIAAGDLPTCRVGRRRLIPADALEAFVSTRTEARAGEGSR